MSRFPGTMLICNWLGRLLLPLLLVTTIDAHKFYFAQSTPGSSEESANLTYHSTASEVRLMFFASDENDHGVEELQKDDFAVVDDERVIRHFRSFTRSELAKLDVIVLIDSSESVLPQFEHEISEVQQMISQWPRSPGNHVSVLSFSGMGTHLVCAENCLSSLPPYQLASIPKGGATPLFDAVEIAANLLIQRRQPDVWPVIILFSDGDDTISKVSFTEISEKILASEAQIYAIDLSGPGQESDGTATLQRIAEDSGGRRVPINEGAVKIFTQVIEDLHSARVVTYATPESDSDFHSTRIFPTHNLNLQFRCRRGYYHYLGSGH